MKVTKLGLAAALLCMPAVMLAQTPAPAATPTPGKNDYNINQRKAAQQQRIGNGVKNGKLTAGQTAHLEHRESSINHEEHAMRAQDNGHLTKQDRTTIHQQQNQASRKIYQDKHE
ncbi:MAG: hypothetical protein WA510_22295 [Acidobacteriaceae bacterium]